MSSIKLLVTNQKGGVGKSTIAANLAAYLAIQYESSISLIDFDKQSSSTKWIEKAPDIGIKIFNPDINFQQTGQLALLEAKRHLKLLTNTEGISISDLTWTGGLPSEFLLEFDFLIIPSATNKFEMASSEIFILEYINHHLHEISKKQQMILLTPSRVDKNFNPEQKFLNLNNIDGCSVTPPIHFIPAIDNFVYEDFLCVSSNHEVAQNFSTFGQYVAELIYQKIKEKQNTIATPNYSNNVHQTVLDKFRHQQIEGKSTLPNPMSKWIPDFLIKK